MPDRICSIDDCERRAYARGWCSKHYQRWLAHGDPDGAPPPLPKHACSADGCAASVISRGMCGTHYARWRRAGGTGRTCSITGCGRSHFGRGWCELHYDRWRANGDPLVVSVIVGDDQARILSHIDRRSSAECWPWTSTLSVEGYGVIQLDGRQVKAHRWVWEHLIGPIPEGLTLDDLCHTNDLTCTLSADCPHRRCVNPAHLEPVTFAENARRARTRRPAA